VFENRVLRGIYGPKGEEVIGGWRKLHNEELHNLYCSPSIIRIIKSRRMRWAGHVESMGRKWNPYRVLVRKTGRKRWLGKPKRRWEDNKVVMLWLESSFSGEITGELLWIRQRTFMFHEKAGSFLTNWATISLSRMTLLDWLRYLNKCPFPTYTATLTISWRILPTTI
jgi:hypothetical protein